MTSKLSAPFLTVFSCFAVSGCTAYFASAPLPDDKIIKGAPYKLAATRITIAADFKLLDCKKTPEIKLVDVKYTTDIVADDRREATFVLDTDKLQAGTKKIPQALVQLRSGILSSVNYKAQDQTASIIGSAAKAVAISQGIPIPLVAASLSEFTPTAASQLTASASPCAQDIQIALQNRSSIVGLLESDRSKIEAITEELASGYFKDGGLGAKQSEYIYKLQSYYLSELDKYVGDYNADRAKAISDIRTFLTSEVIAISAREATWVTQKQAALASLEKSRANLLLDLAEVDKKLTASAVIKWVPNGNSAGQEFEVGELSKWFSPSMQASAMRELGLWGGTNKIKLKEICTNKSFDKPLEGNNSAIYYRIPNRCDIEVTFCGSDCTDKTSNTKIYGVPLAQNGYLAALSIENGPFEDSEFAVSFDSIDGQLVSYSFISNKAALSEAATSLVSAQELLKQTSAEKLDAEKVKIDKEKNLAVARKEKAVAEKEALEAERLLNEERAKTP
ncbi:hypothetical protein BSF43_48900 [Pseudomonas ogarae]|uniref:hypothetical protein n=1 Tax=Pseudomonas ogarae (strain DSM 112162 / CECT 30235 / F113) TaxID=1114970 RepID=UPI000BB2E6C8|nr:hypothetical protein [Pseudomonas ogarae]PBJ02540.1 hypothetical protein BSF43_48900 [Pseudomonas ogarae]